MTEPTQTQPAPATDDNQIIAERREKLRALREQGVAYPNDFRPTHHAADLQADYAEADKDALEAKPLEVKVAGRMMLRRVMGKASFATVQDGSGQIQFFVTPADVGAETYDAFKKWDLGDIVAASGVLFRTNKGELSVKCTELRLLTKALRPLPDKFHGLADQEMRYRQRYVDLIVTPETRDTFRARTKAIASIRKFMADADFLEVETPMLHPIPGGAAAKPFVTHHNALDMEMFLRIAPELYLKRLVVGGFERVFEINRNFRNEGVSPRHNPEFTMMEFYAAYTDYRWLMDFTEQLIRQAAIDALGTATIQYQGRELDLAKPFHRLTIKQAIQKYAPDYSDAQLADVAFLRTELKRFGVDVATGLSERRPGRAAARAVRGNGRGAAVGADLHHRLPGRGLAAGARIGYDARRHRALRAVHDGPRDRQRLLRAERSGRPGRALQEAGRAEGRRRRGSDVLRRRLHPRAGIRHAPDRRLRHRHRPPGDAADRQPDDPRRAPVPAPAPRRLSRVLEGPPAGGGPAPRGGASCTARFPQVSSASSNRQLCNGT